MTLNPQNRVFSEFFAISGCGTHFEKLILPKWLEVDQNDLHIKFSAPNVNFSNLSPDPLGSRTPVRTGVKRGVPL